MGTWAWLQKTFPKYDTLRELDEHHRIIVLPADYLEDDDEEQEAV